MEYLYIEFFFKDEVLESKYKPEYLYTPTSGLNMKKSSLLTSSPVYRATATTSAAYPMCKSAFESDPDVIMIRHRLANRMTSRPIVPTQRLSSRLEPSMFEPKYASTTRRTNRGVSDQPPSPITQLDNDYMNIISCRVKKEGMGSKDLEQDDEQQQQQPQSDDTVESTHLDSDYAKSPIFPSDAYGTRPSVNIPVGIYSNKVCIY